MALFLIVSMFLYGAFGASLERRQILSYCAQMACPAPITQTGPASAIMPVCGSDGVTYLSYCQLQLAACEQRMTGGYLHLSHYGSCSGPDRPPVLSSHQDCGQICDEDRQPICASDGVVYENQCLFQRAQCEAANNGTNLFLVTYADTCPKPRAPECSRYHIDTSDLALEGSTQVGNMQCPYTDQHYVCSTDGRTFLNECLLCHYVDVHQDSQIKILHDGACHSTAQVVYPGGGFGGGVIPIMDGGVAVMGSEGSAGSGVAFPDQDLIIG